MTGHRLLPIGAKPLHPMEALIIAVVTARGNYVGQCECGTLINGNNDIDLYCRFKEHKAAVRAVRG